MRYETFTDFRSMSGNDNHDQRTGEIDLDLSKRHRISIKRPSTMPRALNLSTAAALLTGNKAVKTPIVSSSSKEVVQESRPEPGTSRVKKSLSPPAPTAKPTRSVPLPTRTNTSASSSSTTPIARKSASPPSAAPVVAISPAPRKLSSQGPQAGSSQVAKSLEESKVVKNRPKQSTKTRTIESAHDLFSEEADRLLTTSRSVKGKERAVESSTLSSSSALSSLRFKKKAKPVVNEESIEKTRPTPSEGQVVGLKRRRTESSSSLSTAGAKAFTSTPIVESGINSRGYGPSSASPSALASPRSPPSLALGLKTSKPTTSDEERPRKKMRWDMPPPPLPAKCQLPQEEPSQPELMSPPAQSTSQLPLPVSPSHVSPPTVAQSEAEASTSKPFVESPRPVAHPKSKKAIPRRWRAHAEAVPPEQLEPVEGQPRKYDGAIARCPYKCKTRERVLACNRCKLFMVSDRLTGKMGELIADFRAKYPEEDDDDQRKKK